MEKPTLLEGAWGSIKKVVGFDYKDTKGLAGNAFDEGMNMLGRFGVEVLKFPFKIASRIGITRENINAVFAQTGKTTVDLAKLALKLPAIPLALPSRYASSTLMLPASTSHDSTHNQLADVPRPRDQRSGAGQTPGSADAQSGNLHIAA